MKANYSAWQLDHNDFFQLTSLKQKLEFLIKYAVLAPSSHNTQPWSFRVLDNSIEVYRAHERRLPIADTHDRQLFLSVGCAIENILIAANYFSLDTKIEYFDYPVNHLVAVIQFKENDNKVDENHLTHFIPLRKTNRNKYKSEKINLNILNELTSSSIEDIKIHIINNANKIKLLGEVAIASSIESMIDDSFRHELAHHLKHNLTQSKIGMPGFTLGIPTPVSFFIPSLMRKINLEQKAEKQNRELFNFHTPYIVIITSKNDRINDWVKVGQIFQKFSLIATRYGISLSPWGAPIEIGDFYKEIQKIINTDDRPLMFFRMGYSVRDTKHSPRIPHNEVIK